MPTKLPRIMFTPAPETHALLLRLAAASGQPLSAIVREMLETVGPHLEMITNLLEKAAALSGGVRTAAAEAAQQASDALLPAMQEAERAMRNLERILDEPGLPLGVSEPPSSNTGATSVPGTQRRAA